jgi:hypothetical protein
MGVDDDDEIAVVVFMNRLDGLRTPREEEEEEEEIVVDETRRIDRSKKTAPVLALFCPGEDEFLEALLPPALKKAADVVVVVVVVGARQQRRLAQPPPLIPTPPREREKTMARLVMFCEKKFKNRRRFVCACKKVLHFYSLLSLHISIT